VTHPFLSLTDADRDAMLETIGVASVEELFRDVPERVRFRGELALEQPLTEAELVAHLEELAARNVDTTRELSFLGAGIYDHYVPAIVDTVLQRGEFLTAYTPYQPEMSQGVLQAIFEYQTAICELTGMTGRRSPRTRATSRSTRHDGRRSSSRRRRTRRSARS
jgi:glycine cleavage system P protein (glycine dehydrogenase) subunit 1